MEKKKREIPTLSNYEFESKINTSIEKHVIKQPDPSSKPLTKDTKVLVYFMGKILNKSTNQEHILEDALLQTRSITIWGNKIPQKFFHECLESMKVI